VEEMIGHTILILALIPRTIRAHILRLLLLLLALTTEHLLKETELRVCAEGQETNDDEENGSEFHGDVERDDRVYFSFVADFLTVCCVVEVVALRSVV
jgi:hypothetical protein